MLDLLPNLDEPENLFQQHGENVSVQQKEIVTVHGPGSGSSFGGILRLLC